jgi:hypothetical protein
MYDTLQSKGTAYPLIATIFHPPLTISGLGSGSGRHRLLELKKTNPDTEHFSQELIPETTAPSHLLRKSKYHF